MRHQEHWLSLENRWLPPAASFQAQVKQALISHPLTSLSLALSLSQSYPFPSVLCLLAVCPLLLSHSSSLSTGLDLHPNPLLFPLVENTHPSADTDYSLRDYRIKWCTPSFKILVWNVPCIRISKKQIIKPNQYEINMGMFLSRKRLSGIFPDSNLLWCQYTSNKLKKIVLSGQSLYS